MSKNNRKYTDTQKTKQKDSCSFKPNSKHNNNDDSSRHTSTKLQIDRVNRSASSQVTNDRPSSLEAMMLDVQRRQQQFEQLQNSIDDDEDTSGCEPWDGQERSRKTFYREFKKVVDASDIIIEVLDARDPLGSRCSQVEEMVLTSGKNKKLILLLNKIDLIPRENLDRWLKYLRNEYPTIPFRSSIQTQRDRLGHINIPVKACDEHLLRSSNTCIGASTLMKLLSNYCRKYEIKTSITVGIVGFPNVGKSSVINSLKRSQACETGSTPGLTKQMQTVKLDKLIKLLDSPGIVISRETNAGLLILRNCIRIETIDNPLPAIELILQRCTKEQILHRYGVDEFHDATDFLLKLATRMGCLRKGGTADTNQAAQRVLLDWNNGRLTYCTEPPERSSEILNTELVNRMENVFDIESMLSDEKDYLQETLDSPVPEYQLSRLTIQNDSNLFQEQSKATTASSMLTTTMNSTDSKEEAISCSQLPNDL